MSLMSNGDDNPTTNGGGEEVEAEPHFDPIIYLPEVHVHSNEEGEAILIQLRAKLFRHDNTEKLWKERGTGEVKLLYNEETNAVRVVMRRDKTLKLCANHYVTTDMELKSNCGSDRAWVWSTQADISDGDPHPEVLAIRFQNADAAKRFKDKFEEAKTIVATAVKVSEDEKDEDKDSDRKCTAGVDFREKGKAVSEASDIGGSSDEEVAKAVSKLDICTESKDQKYEKQETEIKKDEPKDS